MKQKLLLLVMLFIAGTGHAQEADTTMPEQYVNKEFVIILSSKKYDEALRAAKAAATKLKVKLDLRGLKPNKTIGLSWGKKVCEEEWFGSPCYVARGRFDDGEYISIEYSSAYDGFKEGYYIVVAAGGEQGDDAVKKSLAKARKSYKDAYAKRSKVYTGCMH